MYKNDRFDRFGNVIMSYLLQKKCTAKINLVYLSLLKKSLAKRIPDMIKMMIFNHHK